MSWICGTQWGYCQQRSRAEGNPGRKHRCTVTARAAKDHDHVCQVCGRVRKAKT